MASAARVSIKEYLLPYVLEFAQKELGTDDITEAVNLLILDHKRQHNGIPIKSGKAFQPITAQPTTEAIAPPSSTLDDLDEEFLANLENAEIT
ncbi:MAG: hypothetical protein VKK04_25625 [Synechococcales bacterium]|nr:hypothetical protein [Synechococcales bacterium]